MGFPDVKRDSGNNGLRQWADTFLGIGKGLNPIPVVGGILSAIPMAIGSLAYEYVFWKELRAGRGKVAPIEAPGIKPKPGPAHGYKAVAMAATTTGAFIKFGSASQIGWWAASTALKIISPIISAIGILMWGSFFAYSWLKSRRREDSQIKQGIVPKYSRKFKWNSRGKLISGPDGVAATTGTTQIGKKIVTISCGVLALTLGLIGTFLTGGILLPILAAVSGVIGSILWLNISQVAKNKTYAFEVEQERRKLEETRKSGRRELARARLERMRARRKVRRDPRFYDPIVDTIDYIVPCISISQYFTHRRHQPLEVLVGKAETKVPDSVRTIESTPTHSPELGSTLAL